MLCEICLYEGNLKCSEYQSTIHIKVTFAGYECSPFQQSVKQCNYALVITTSSYKANVLS